MTGSASRRARRARFRDPTGVPLTPALLLVTGRDSQGRPSDCRVLYDEQTLGEALSPDVKNECLLVWMTDYQLGKRTS